MIEQIRVAVLNSNNEVIAFMDNEHKQSMHYFNDEIHEYLQGAANTFKFTVNAKHEDSIYILEGNKVSFIAGGKHYFLNIVRVERDEETVNAEAWSLSFELVNEYVGAYKAPKAMSFQEYLNVFDPEKTLKVGQNEVADKNIKNEWTGESSILARLFSLANVFGAEIEFKTILNKDYTLKEIVMNVYKEWSDTNQGIGELRDDVVLRYGRGIAGITKKSDITELYTCIQPVGTDGVTLDGLTNKEYDSEGKLEYFVDGGLIRAPQARDRFPSNVINKKDSYILRRKSYDTSDKNKLYSMALSTLKAACQPDVTYDVTGYFETNIGDTVRIADEEFTPELYLRARVTEQVRSFTDPANAKTIFSNITELASEVDKSILDKVQNLIEKYRTYTCSIATDNGIIFKNGEGETTLRAYVYQEGVNIAEQFTIIWFRDGKEIQQGETVLVKAEDIDGKSVYSFNACDKDGIKRGSYEVTILNMLDGVDGTPGVGVRYSVITYQIGTVGNVVPTGAWSPTIPSVPDGQYLWTRTITYFTDGSSITAYSVGKMGEAGADGSNGSDGKGVKSIIEQYYQSTSATALSGGSWGTTYPGWVKGKFIWTRSIITYTDGTTTTTTAICVSGATGETGATGKGVQSIVNYYLASSSDSDITISTTGWTTTVQSISATNKYLWNYEVINYTDGSKGTTTPCIIGVYGDKGNTGATGATGATGNGIKTIAEKYAVSSSNSTAPTTWQDTVPTLTATNKYLWNYEIITYTNGSKVETQKRVIGVYGDKGNTGATGSSGIIVSTTAPSNPKVGQLWQKESGQPINRWDGSKWIVHYISVENLNVQSLSAITANLGIVTAGVVKSTDETMVIDVANGVITSRKVDQGVEYSKVELISGALNISGKNSATLRKNLHMNMDEIVVKSVDSGKTDSLTFEGGEIYANGKPLVNIVNRIYPVGSIYLSVNPTNPSSLFGGTWVAWGQGRVPIGIGSNGTTNYTTANATGGAEKRSHNHSAATSGSTALTVNQIPSHNHQGQFYYDSTNKIGNKAAAAGGSFQALAVDSSTHTFKPPSVGGGQGHTHSIPATNTVSVDIRQPYITCYMWRRTG